VRHGGTHRASGRWKEASIGLSEFGAGGPRLEVASALVSESTTELSEALRPLTTKRFGFHPCKPKLAFQPLRFLSQKAGPHRSSRIALTS